MDFLKKEISHISTIYNNTFQMDNKMVKFKHDVTKN